MTKLWLYFSTTHGWTGLLLANLTLTALMTGLIWFVQLVHYPLMAYADKEQYAEFQLRHEFLTSLIVVPVMLAELAVAGVLVLLLFDPASVLGSQTKTLVIANAVLLVVVWGSTFLIQVPCHQMLNQGYEESTHAWLVSSNWIRTSAWTLKLTVAIWAIGRIFNQGQTPNFSGQ